MLRYGKLIIAVATGCVLTVGGTAALAGTGSHRAARHSPDATAAQAYAFWRGTNGNLYEAQGPANGGLAHVADRGMGPLNSTPAAGVDGSGSTFVYWQGTAPGKDLYEGYWDGSRWVGPFDRGQGPLGSQPAAAITAAGTAYVFWEGSNHQLYEAKGPADGSLSGPTYLGMGPLGSAPTAGVDSSGSIFVYWRGLNGALYEAYSNGSAWLGPFDRGHGPLGSPPGAAITADGTAYVFWKGTNHQLYEVQGPANGGLAHLADRGMGPLGSAPTAGVDSSGSTFVYWRGKAPGKDIFEGYWNGSRWVGPFNRGDGPLRSLPAVAIFG